MTPEQKIREQIAWVESEADLYDQQGLTVDMEHADKLYALKRTLEALLEVYEAAKEVRDSKFNAYENTESGSYGIGVTDGHRFCTNLVREAIAKVESLNE